MNHNYESSANLSCMKTTTTKQQKKHKHNAKIKEKKRSKTSLPMRNWIMIIDDFHVILSRNKSFIHSHNHDPSPGFD